MITLSYTGHIPFLQLLWSKRRTWRRVHEEKSRYFVKTMEESTQAILSHSYAMMRAYKNSS